MNGTESNLCKVELQNEIISSEFLVERIVQLYGQICMLESLKPLTAMNALFTQLVHACTIPIYIDVNKLNNDVKEIHFKLICLCAEAKSLMETHFSQIIGPPPQPLSNIHLFPYYSNYINLALMEFNTLSDNNIPLAKELDSIGFGIQCQAI
jgi:hypothetical protein